MKGKKVNSEFISNFISECISFGKLNSEDILAEAKEQIKEIDKKIIEVENLKVKRSNLIDVISTIDKNESKTNINDIKTLSFFQVRDLNICKYICDKIRENPVNISELKDYNIEQKDLFYCIKQLIERKIISKSGEVILRGDSYYEFLNFIFMEKNEQN